MLQSSKTETDPLSEIFGVLDAKVTRLTRLEAGGQWALGFPALDRLKFVALLRGSQWVLIPGSVPQLMTGGDVCLLGRTPYTVASHPNLTPTDGRAFYANPNSHDARIGGNETIGVGGTVTFAGANADFLLDMLPEFMMVPRSLAASGVIASILELIRIEIERDQIGSKIVSTRLADVLLVHAIRAYAGQVGQSEIGWLGALLHPRLGRALRALHNDVSQPWTVARLASVAGMSRAAFAAEFTRRVGRPPLAYLRSWRLTIARAALASDDAAVSSIASRVGYTSHSAFSNAFRRTFGYSPKAGAPRE